MLPPTRLPTRLQRWLQPWWPAPLAIDIGERWRVAIGAGLGLLVAGGLSHWAAGLVGSAAGLAGPAAAASWLVAPLGASAVLVFGLPASPLAQPWAVVTGNTVSALVGVLCAALLPWPMLAGPLAVALAIAAMLALRCLHPPGGAVALLAVSLSAQHWQWALFPVLTSSALLVGVAWAYNRATGARYPHPQTHPQTHPQAPADGPAASQAEPFTEGDINAALGRFNQLSHLPRDELKAMLGSAQAHAHARRLDDLRCSDIMSAAPTAVEFGTSLQDAWALLHSRRIKALPVIDRSRRIVGILTRADFTRAAQVQGHEGAAARLRHLIRPTPGAHSDKAEVVGQIMTRKVRVTSAHRSLGELVPIFSSSGHHHLPVVGEDQRLVGIVTQSDLVRALALGP